MNGNRNNLSFFEYIENDHHLMMMMMMMMVMMMMMMMMMSTNLKITRFSYTSDAS